MYIDFPAPEYLADGRDRSTVSFLIPRTRAAVHVCILWSERRDQRILAVLTAFSIRNPSLLKQLVAVAESRGRVDFWCRSAEHAKDLQQALDAAAAAVHLTPEWTANSGQVVPCKGTVVDWQALPEGHVLRSPAKGHGLGLIEVRT
jgi:hypothetical protein